MYVIELQQISNIISNFKFPICTCIYYVMSQIRVLPSLIMIKTAACTCTCIHILIKEFPVVIVGGDIVHVYMHV